MNKEYAREGVKAASTIYLRAQNTQEEAHSYLKDAVKAAKAAGLTQQEIADATEVQVDDTGFKLSRQRISQIVNGE